MRGSRLIVAALALALLAGPAQASPQSAAAQKKAVASKLQKSKSVVRFYNGKGRWALHVGTKRCWMLASPRDERICRTARENLRWHIIRIDRLEHRLKVLSAPPGMSAAAASWWVSSGARCVKREEAAWNQGSYYDRWQSWAGREYPEFWGGFQADISFLRTYGRAYLRHYGYPEAYERSDGRWVWTNPWPVGAQIEMAYRGWRARGWHPWPNTARECGLL